MSESYIKAEIVRPKQSTEEMVSDILKGLAMLATRVLVVWWFFATWLPELGYTYWQLVLPVYAARAIISRGPFGRQLK